MALGAYIMTETKSDANDYQDVLIFDIDKGDYILYYKVRSTVVLNQAPGFSLTDRSALGGTQAKLVSLPMYAFHTGQSLSQIPYERLMVKMKDRKNTDDVNKVKLAFQR